jgi:hypothetical protein
MVVNTVNGEETNLATNTTPANKEDSLLKGYYHELYFFEGPQISTRLFFCISAYGFHKFGCLFVEKFEIQSLLAVTVPVLILKVLPVTILKKLVPFFR